ncbi:MAG: hypothetical protein ACI9GK_001848 [Devosia sp.]|jgi:uncharacterized protein YbjT (DUF2867 family)
MRILIIGGTGVISTGIARLMLARNYTTNSICPP